MQVTIKTPPSTAPDAHCPVRDVIARLGNKWTGLIISHVAAMGSIRFGELKRRIGGISQRMLTESVRGLERDGVLMRTVYATIPPRVEYSLTPLGETLVGPVQALIHWAIDHREEIKQARTAYDSEQTEVPGPISATFSGH